MNVGSWWPARKSRREPERQRQARINRGVDLVVKMVDPRLRGVPRYRARLAPALERAAIFADELVATLPEPIDVARDHWADSPGLRAFFASVDEMQAFFDENRGLRDVLTRTAARGAGTGYAASGVRMDRRSAFGIQHQGDLLQHEREPVSVSFSQHRIGALAVDAGSVRSCRRRLILKEIATRAMQRVAARKVRRDAPTEEEATLRWKLTIFRSSK